MYGAIDISDRLQCKLDFVAIPLLIAAGALIGNKVGIFPKEFDETWVVYPALWGAIVGPPGSMKTPAQNEAFKMLYHFEEHEHNQYKLKYVAYKQTLDQYQQSLKNSKSNSITLLTPPVTPQRKRYIVNDTTYQALGVVLSENPNGILALSDELSGLLQSLDTAGQEAARAFFLSGWGGSGNCSFDRIGRDSIHLKNYCLSVFGGFQPERLKLYAKQTNTGSSKNDGLIQRFQLLVWPNLNQHTALIDRLPDQNAIKLIANTFNNLNHHTNGTKLHYVKQAQYDFNQWFLKNEGFINSGLLDSARHSHYAKYRSLIPALSLLYHLIDAHIGSVCSDCLNKAIAFSEYLKSHAERVYQSVQGMDNAPMLTLSIKLKNKELNDEFTLNDLIHKGWTDLTNKSSAQNAINGLIAWNWLKEVEKKGVGRPTFKYLINPGIYLLI